MFNQNIGIETNVDGNSYVLTKRGELGHVVWGNYVRLHAGRYCVIFGISIDGEIFDPLAKNYGFVEIVTDAGKRLMAKGPILAETLPAEASPFGLILNLRRPRLSRLGCTFTETRRF